MKSELTVDAPVDDATEDAAATPSTAPERAKKKPKYSKKLATFQKVVGAINSGSAQLAHALSTDLREWDKEWDRQARRRKDGGLRGIGKAFNKATSANWAQMKRIPGEASRGYDGKQLRRLEKAAKRKEAGTTEQPDTPPTPTVPVTYIDLRKKDKRADRSPGAASASTDGPDVAPAEVKKKKKKKMRYSSRNAAIFQKSVRTFVVAGRSATDSLVVLLDDWDVRWKRLIREEVDGGLRNFYPEYAKSWAAGLRATADVPILVAERVPQPDGVAIAKSVSKALRRFRG